MKCLKCKYFDECRKTSKRAAGCDEYKVNPTWLVIKWSTIGVFVTVATVIGTATQTPKAAFLWGVVMTMIIGIMKEE